LKALPDTKVVKEILGRTEKNTKLAERVRELAKSLILEVEKDAASTADGGIKERLAMATRDIAQHVPDETLDLYQGDKPLVEAVYGAIDATSSEYDLSVLAKAITREALLQKGRGGSEKLSPMPFKEDPYFPGIWESFQ